MDAFDYYNDWSDRLNSDLRTLSLQEILDSSIDILGATLMLADASYYILAHAETVDGNLDDDAYQAVRAHGIMGIEHILNIERDAKIREYRRRSYIQYTGGFSINPSVRNLFTGGNHWGWLISVLFVMRLPNRRYRNMEVIICQGFLPLVEQGVYTKPKGVQPYARDPHTGDPSLSFYPLISSLPYPAPRQTARAGDTLY